MACVALASLMSTIELEFLQPIPRVSLHHDHQPTIKLFFENLSSVQAFLQKESSGGGGAIKDLEIKIRDFALKAEDGIEIQLSNFILAEDSEYQEKASQELHQTLREAAENAAELLKIINSTTSNEVDEANETQSSIHHRSKQDLESENVELDGSSWHSPRLENKMVGRDDDYAMIKYQLVDKMVGDGIEMIIQRIMDRMGNREYNEMMIRQRLMDRMVDRFELKLIWIVGMPGIGKTTLAKSVYEDPIMKEYFDVQVWITMPQKYNQRELLCNLLLSIAVATEPSEIRRTPPCELADQGSCSAQVLEI